MPFSVAAQRGIYMVVYGVTQKDIQFIVFDRANMGGDIIPQDPVALLNVGILQGQIVFICGGFGLRPGAISTQCNGDSLRAFGVRPPVRTERGSPASPLQHRQRSGSE